MIASRLATSLLLLGATSLAGCSTSDLPLSPTAPPTTAGNWAGSWRAFVGETTLFLGLSRQGLDGFWNDSFRITGLGTLTPPESEGAPISLSVIGSSRLLSGMVLEIYDRRLPESPAPGTVVTATRIATFRATFMSDTLLVGALTAEDPLLASGEVRFRRR